MLRRQQSRATPKAPHRRVWRAQRCVADAVAGNESGQGSGQGRHRLLGPLEPRTSPGIGATGTLCISAQELCGALGHGIDIICRASGGKEDERQREEHAKLGVAERPVGPSFGQLVAAERMNKAAEFTKLGNRRGAGAPLDCLHEGLKVKFSRFYVAHEHPPQRSSQRSLRLEARSCERSLHGCLRDTVFPVVERRRLGRRGAQQAQERSAQSGSLSHRERVDRVWLVFCG
mmetsp:Transcript_7404/g.23347  ORF Transcript_7404/g.23347 Transcript_7404/m.23347 type:complete len:231 (-) Transcript_7404:99-791(-)